MPRSAILFLLVAMPVLAPLQSTANADERITVTAVRNPIALDRFGGSATIITAEDIASHGYRSLADALQYVPGLHLARSGGSGAQTSVFVRGAESNHVVVMIDGQEVTDPASLGSAALQHLQLNDVARIEILRGPYSVQYGSEAIGGVIYITTRRAGETRRLSSLLEYGSFDSKLATFGWSAGDGRQHLSANVSYQDEGGESFTPSRLHRSGDQDEDDAYQNLDAKFNIGMNLSDIANVELNYAHIDADTDYDTITYDATFTEIVSTEDSRAEATAKQNRTGIKLSVSTKLWRSDWQASYYESENKQHGTFSGVTRGQRQKFEWHNQFLFSEDLIVLAGLENELEEIKTRDFSSLEADARNYAAYAELRLSPSPDWLVSGGLRYDDPDGTEGENSSQISLSWHPLAYGLKLHAAYGTAFKTPTLSERFSFGGNPDLLSEKSRAWEAGIEYGADSKHRFGITYFNNDIRNLIAYDFIQQLNRNIGRASIEGLELLLSSALSDSLLFNADYTITRAKDGNRERLPRRPLRQGGFNLAWQFAAATAINLQGLYVGATEDVQRDSLFGQRVVQGSYAVFDLSLLHRLNEQLTLSVRADNVLDKEYEPVNGYRGKGASLYLGLSYITE